jgi:hypothetical protein
MKSCLLQELCSFHKEVLVTMETFGKSLTGAQSATCRDFPAHSTGGRPKLSLAASRHWLSGERKELTETEAARISRTGHYREGHLFWGEEIVLEVELMTSLLLGRGSTLEPHSSLFCFCYYLVIIGSCVFVWGTPLTMIILPMDSSASRTPGVHHHTWLSRVS